MRSTRRRRSERSPLSQVTLPSFPAVFSNHIPRLQANPGARFQHECIHLRSFSQSAGVLFINEVALLLTAATFPPKGNPEFFTMKFHAAEPKGEESAMLAIPRERYWPWRADDRTVLGYEPRRTHSLAAKKQTSMTRLATSPDGSFGLGGANPNNGGP
jgi:hypothetical protein